jgi:hypothetical protein
MTYLGLLSGTGRLVVQGTDIGSVDYEIHVHQNGTEEGRGFIKADDCRIKPKQAKFFQNRVVRFPP